MQKRFMLGFACLLFAGYTVGMPKTTAALTEDPGYFTGNNITLPSYFLYEHDVLDFRDKDPSAVSIPSYVYNGSNDKNDFINWVDGLVPQNSTANTRNELGGAFIVNTMTRQTSPSKNVTTAMFDDFKNRILNPNISFHMETADPNTYCKDSAGNLINGGEGCKISFYGYGDSARFDDLYATWGGAQVGQMLVFEDSTGKVLYVLEVPCANPLGNLAGLPAYNPDRAPSISVDNVNCPAGTIRVEATDPDYSGALTVQLINSAGTVVTSGLTNSSDEYTFSVASSGRFTTAQSYSVRVLGVDKDGDKTGLNDTASVTIGPCNTSSCGTHTFPSSMAVGAAVSFSASVELYAWTSPPYTASDNPTMFVYVKDPTGTNVYSNEDVVYTVSGNVLTTVPAISFTPNTAGTYQMQWGIRGAGLDKSCPGPGASDWVESNAGYRPYFTVTGGDIISGGGVRSWNIDGVGGSYVGAGTNLAAIANGDVQNFVTGFGLSTGAATRGGAGLGFSNNAAGVGGSTYARGFNVDPFAPQIDTTTLVWASATLDLGDPSLQDGITYVRTGNLTISGQLPTGKTITVVVAGGGSAIIAGNTTYGAYSNKSEVPRLTLNVQNGNIYVGSGVTEMHGVYIVEGSGANGNFYSCSSGAAAVAMSTATAYNTCRNKLTVFGAVAASRLILDRTYGSYVAATGIPVDSAETFYYSPELWLADDGSAASSRDTKIDSYTSLPPVL